jgi:hypothetical protein
MNQRSLGALIALNVALLIAVVVVSLSPKAQAAAAGRGTYTMIAGITTWSAPKAVIYIMDTNSMTVGAVLYDSSQDTFKVMDRRDIVDDMSKFKKKAGRP